MSNRWGFENTDDGFESRFAGAALAEQPDDAYRTLLQEVKSKIAANALFEGAASKQQVVEEVAGKVIDSYLDSAASQNRPILGDPAQLVRRMVDDIIGWGPLAGPMKDPSIEDLIVKSPTEVWAFHAGSTGWQRLSGVAFTTWDEIRDLVNNKADHRGTGKPINEANPRINAQLPDGSRLHAIMSPLTVEPGPVITIRRFRAVAKSTADLVKVGHMTEGAAQLLGLLMQARESIAIVGGTGSGKTTVANSLLSQCSPQERVITCEDTPEIQIPVPLWTQLQTKDESRPGAGDGVDMAQLVKENLRMRPDRIIIGEVRDGAMGAVLQAGNTGHDGILFTVHSNDPWSAISRMETLALMDKTLATLPIVNLRLMITTALDFIIHVGLIQTPKGRARRLLTLTEIRGMQGDQVQMEDILRYDPKADRALWTGSYLSEDRLARLDELCPGFDFRRDLSASGGL